MLHVLTGTRSRTALLALVLTGVFAGTAAAAAGLTIDSTAPLSPGRLHATLSGSVTCNPGDSTYLSGQISQTKGASGFGSTQITCTGAPQHYTIDVGANGFPFGGGGGPFKAGKASAQVSYSTCTDPFFPICTTQYTDAIIRLTK
ncbi:MAG: hypothetical protein QOJ46_1572 [bacterium]|jgi:hypothetical protein